VGKEMVSDPETKFMLADLMAALEREAQASKADRRPDRNPAYRTLTSQTTASSETRPIIGNVTDRRVLRVNTVDDQECRGGTAVQLRAARS
jgi:hypothetical protein